MSDGDKDALAAVLVVEKPLLAAALVALFLASSAYLWRAKISRSGSVLVPLHAANADEPKQSSNSAADAERAKNPRTKERRRRGKDPLRDLLKNGKKLKAFSKINIETKTSPALHSVLPLDAFAPSSSLCVSARTEDDGAAQEPSPAGLDVSGSDALEPGPPLSDQPCDSPATQSQLSSTSLPSESGSTPTGTQGLAMPASVSRSSEEEDHSLSHPPSNGISYSPRRVPGADGTVVVNGFHATRHAPTPRRAPTPSSGTNTPPPSVAIQTQLASLRGALEAARQREAQMKSDLERYAKELEFMRWESHTWRRRELELQNQVNYLSHQLQTLAASFSPVPSGAPSVVSSPPPQNGKASSSSSASSSSATSPTKNGYHVPLPAQTPPQTQPSSLHIIPPPSGLFSPIPMIHTPVYYSYPPVGGNHSHHHNYSHFSPHSQPHPHSFTLSPTQPASLMSMFSSNGTVEPSSGGGNSGPSSAPDSSSSVGSLSPDISNLAVDRGRRRMRSGMHMGGWTGIGAEEENGYPQEGGGYDESSCDDESEVSEVLADAILKRPGTLKLGKSRSRTLRSSPSAEPTADGKGSPDSESQTEFTFPSLSAFGGNVRWDKKPRVSEPVGLQNGNGSIVTTAEASSPSLDDLEKVEQLDTEAQKSAVKESQPNASELPAG